MLLMRPSLFENIWLEAPDAKPYTCLLPCLPSLPLSVVWHMCVRVRRAPHWSRGLASLPPVFPACLSSFHRCDWGIGALWIGWDQNRPPVSVASRQQQQDDACAFVPTAVVTIVVGVAAEQPTTQPAGHVCPSVVLRCWDAFVAAHSDSFYDDNDDGCWVAARAYRDAGRRRKLLLSTRAKNEAQEWAQLSGDQRRDSETGWKEDREIRRTGEKTAKTCCVSSPLPSPFSPIPFAFNICLSLPLLLPVKHEVHHPHILTQDSSAHSAALSLLAASALFGHRWRRGTNKGKKGDMLERNVPVIAVAAYMGFVRDYTVSRLQRTHGSKPLPILLFLLKRLLITRLSPATPNKHQ